MTKPEDKIVIKIWSKIEKIKPLFICSGKCGTCHEKIC